MRTFMKSLLNYSLKNTYNSKYKGELKYAKTLFAKAENYNYTEIVDLSGICILCYSNSCRRSFAQRHCVCDYRNCCLNIWAVKRILEISLQ